ncbi:MAG TPA: TfoX/Sxy family protein, partial [Candidatus Thermoplasmatota archaeon]|nr:TfoX/Sxy family protein [Candidatus Thermoplasmatota archaeon]
MGYDEGLAERIRDVLPKAVEKKMFGGIGWMERGHLVTGVMGDAMGDPAILVRCPPAATAALLKEEGAHPFEQRGKAMKGWVLVDAEAVADDDQL